VRAELLRCGLLPFSDSKVPSLVSIVAGGPIAGSWWGHPAGPLIYEVGGAIEDEAGILVVRLWRGKRTLVHRRLWPALHRIGTARSPWQVRGVSDRARRLLMRVARDGTLSDTPGRPGVADETREVGRALRELDTRLLLLTRSVHTSTGAHALEAKSWSAWSAEVRIPRFPGSVREAEGVIEEASRCLSPGIEPRRVLPWGRSTARSAAAGRESSELRAEQ
jgi:hypothetical protein